MNSVNWKLKNFDQLTTEELYKILQLRIEVFVIEQNCPYPEADGYDQKALHLWGEIDGEIAAYCRIFKPGIKYQESSIGRVVTAPQFRRLQLGKTLMNFAVEVIKNKLKTENIRISAQDYLINFYQNFGFKDTGRKYLEDNIPHTEMLKTGIDS